MGRANADNKFGVTSFVVGPILGDGVNYTSIQQAVTDAGVNPVDIYIRPGTYTENLSTNGNVYLIATDASGSHGPPVANAAHVVIVGDHTINQNALTVCQGIFFSSTVTGFTLSDTATGGVAKLECLNCFFLAAGVGFSLGDATGNGELVLKDCQVESVGRCVVVPTGSIGGFYEIANSGLQSSGDGVVYVDSAVSQGIVRDSTLSGAGASPFTFDLNSAGATLDIQNSYLSSPATATITFQAGATVSAYHNTHNTNGNGEYITGPGNYIYGDEVVITGMGGAAGIDNAAVQTKNGWRPWAESDSSGTSVIRGTASFDSGQFSVVDGFVQLSGSNSPPFSDVSGAVPAIANNGYYATAATTFTLDSGPDQGDIIIIYVDTASSVVVTANTGQFIRLGTQLSSAAGTATNTLIGDSLTLRYRLSTTTWESVASIGNWTLA